MKNTSIFCALFFYALTSSCHPVAVKQHDEASEETLSSAYELYLQHKDHQNRTSYTTILHTLSEFLNIKDHDTPYDAYLNAHDIRTVKAIENLWRITSITSPVHLSTQIEADNRLANLCKLALYITTYIDFSRISCNKAPFQLVGPSLAKQRRLHYLQAIGISTDLASDFEDRKFLRSPCYTNTTWIANLLIALDCSTKDPHTTASVLHAFLDTITNTSPKKTLHNIDLNCCLNEILSNHRHTRKTIDSLDEVYYHAITAQFTGAHQPRLVNGKLGYISVLLNRLASCNCMQYRKPHKPHIYTFIARYFGLYEQ